MGFKATTNSNIKQHRISNKSGLAELQDRIVKGMSYMLCFKLVQGISGSVPFVNSFETLQGQLTGKKYVFL